MPKDSFTPALARLDPANRALLDLSLRREMRPEEIGDLLGTDPESVIVAREAALEQLASELGYYDSPDLDDLRTRLGTLPSEAWTAPAEEPPALKVVSGQRTPTRTPAPRKERRSRMPLLLAVLAVAAIVLVIALASGGDDENTASNAPAPSGQPGTPSGSKPAPKPTGVKLASVSGAAGATGRASLVKGGKRLRLDVTGLPAGSYEVWLYDSVIDARSIAKATGTKIALTVNLPPTASHYRYIDVSREPPDGNPNHSGESVLRVPLAKLSR